MDSMRAFAMGEIHRDEELMVFDWIRAAQIIKERGAKSAAAGLSMDWEWTGGDILRDGKPIDQSETYVYLASTWAKPELEIDGVTVNCFVAQSKTPGGAWDAHTYWPDEALAILSGGVEKPTEKKRAR